MFNIILSLILICNITQDTTQERKEIIQELNNRVESLESRVSQYEMSEHYFTSVLQGERVLWSTVVLIIITAVSGASYLKFRSDVDSISDDMDNFREDFEKLKDDQLESRAHIYITHSNHLLEFGDNIGSFRYKVSAIDALADIDNMNEVRNKLLHETVEACMSDIETSVENEEEMIESNYESVKRKIDQIISKEGFELKTYMIKIRSMMDDINVVDS